MFGQHRESEDIGLNCVGNVMGLETIKNVLLTISVTYIYIPLIFLLFLSGAYVCGSMRPVLDIMRDAF